MNQAEPEMVEQSSEIACSLIKFAVEISTMQKAEGEKR
jgi:hypothetical protein